MTHYAINQSILSLILEKINTMLQDIFVTEFDIIRYKSIDFYDFLNML